MSSTDATQLYGKEHVRRYRETDGEVGHNWKEGATILLLTTTGRRTGRETTAPLIYNLDGDTPVIVASQGGAPGHPGWFKNLSKTPEVGVQIRGDRFRARARVAEGEERERLWELMNEVWPHYDDYATRTDRIIPVVVLDRE
jgi:deazaflavin-dependent oxidoreductase (nitroreductase family)